jgi:hypothetical protein
MTTFADPIQYTPEEIERDEPLPGLVMNVSDFLSSATIDTPGQNPTTERGT